MILSHLAILFPGGRMREGCFLMKTRNVSTARHILSQAYDMLKYMH